MNCVQNASLTRFFVVGSVYACVVLSLVCVVIWCVLFMPCVRVDYSILLILPAMCKKRLA